jgi:energy-coupling factor transporter ATP-binding protein EcfA2
VLLVDEVLAVGDAGFTHKCLDKFSEFRRRGKTVLLVTHSLGLVERLCDEALWLESGHVRGLGDPPRVVGAYITAVERSEERQLAAGDARARAVAAAAPAPAEGVDVPLHPVDTAEGPQDMFRATEGRWGSREVEITEVTLLGGDRQPSHLFHSGERMAIRMKVRAPQRVKDFVFGVGLFNADGVCCYGTNTHLEQLVSEGIEGEGEVTFSIDSLDLTEGTYKLDVAVHRQEGAPYDYHRLLYTFRVKSRTKDVGIYRPPHRWEFTANIRLRPEDM